MMLRALRSAFFRGFGVTLMVIHSAQAQSPVLPSGGQVTAGSATISSSGNQLSINQNSNRAIIDWQSFSIGQNGTVNFNMPGSGSAVLNRVTGDTSSTIAGTLNANGQVYLVNPNGIAITQSGTVKVGGGFVASSLSMSSSDFLAGILNFSGNSSGSVSNAGSISTGRGGFVGLLSNDGVSNAGTISAPAGRVALGTGSAITLDPTGSGFMQILAPATGQGTIDMPGEVRARGGRVEIKASAVERAVRNLVNVGGSVDVSSVYRKGGTIVLEGGTGRVSVNGRLSASSSRKQGGRIAIDGGDISLTDATLDLRGTTGGTLEIGNQTQSGKTATVTMDRATIDASSQDSTATGTIGKGGDIAITAGVVTIRNSAIKANGVAGGGQVRIGGDYQGKGTLAHAQTVTIADTSIEADALSSGNGGRIIVWSDKSSTVGGVFTARALGDSGDGGLIETSSHGVLTLKGPRVSASSAAGRAGLWLLDPQNLDIDAAGAANISAALTTSNVTITTSPSCALASCGTFSNSGTPATDGTITLNAAITKTGSTATTLTLLADANIVLNAGISASGGVLTVNLTAAGNVSGSGALNTNGGALTISAGSGSGTLSGVISGSGSLVKNGAGTLTLSAANTYTGATRVNAGTLWLSNTSTSSALSIAAGSILQVGNSGLNYTFNATTDSTVTGLGTFRKVGTNTVTFAAQFANFTWGLGAGALIDVQAGVLVGGAWSRNIWTGNLSDLNVASGATFSGIESSVIVDKITGTGTISSGYSVGGG